MRTSAASRSIRRATLEAALPPGLGHLADLVPTKEWHRHHLSGKSSQTLAVGLLGAAAERDPSLAWLWEALSPLPPVGPEEPSIRFEQPLDPGLLNEHPRVTAVDVLVEDPQVVICIEAKWREGGIGTCSCADSGGMPAEGRCTELVLERDAYWSAAAEIFGLPERVEGRPCPISLSYQAIRNAAAARALAGSDRLAVFGLLFDQNNPYFRPTGTWPGWPALLVETVRSCTDSRQFRFAAISWQELLPLLPLNQTTRAWAAEKHGLRV